MIRALSLVVALAGGCGFSVSGGSAGQDDRDASTELDAAPDTPDNPPADAASDTTPDMPADVLPPDMQPQAWVTIETISVPCQGMPQQSTTVLANGVSYRLLASGTCIANTQNNSGADAEYIGWNVQQNPDDTSDGDDVGLAVNHPANASTKSPRWGNFTLTHEYQAMFMGVGATIAVAFVGGNLTNNSGNLTFAIQAFQ